jgi:hypothetical protein
MSTFHLWISKFLSCLMNTYGYRHDKLVIIRFSTEKKQNKICPFWQIVYLSIMLTTYLRKQ